MTALLLALTLTAAPTPTLEPDPGTAKRLQPRQLDASSFLANGWNKFAQNYLPLYAGDDDPATAWVEGAEGPGVLIDVGIADDFTPPAWKGGTVQGTIVPGPEQPTLIQRLTGKAVPERAMLVADAPVPGLRASEVPSGADLPNNHLAYAIQWFFFAATALIIYVLAVRRRLQR